MSPNCPGYNPDESDLTVTGESESELRVHGRSARTSPRPRMCTSLTKDALASWTRSAKPALARCLGHIFREGIVEDGGKATIVKRAACSFPRFGPRTAAFRVSARVSVTQAGKTTTIPFTIQVVGVGRGRADATLFALGPGAGIPARRSPRLGEAARRPAGGGRTLTTGNRVRERW